MKGNTRVDVDHGAGRRDPVDSREFAVAAVARIPRLDPSYFLLGGDRQPFDAAGRSSIEVKRAIGSHRIELMHQREHRARPSKSAADSHKHGSGSVAPVAPGKGGRTREGRNLGPGSSNASIGSNSKEKAWKDGAARRD